MSAVTVERPGVLASAQDLGRFGLGSLGVAVSGAADRASLRVGNRLVGNPDGAAAIETTLVGGSFRFTDDRVIALTGSACGASVVAGGGTREAPMWRAFHVHAGDVVECGAMRAGLRTYLCIGGGVETPQVLGSRSTHATTGLGSALGRTLRAGDRVELGRPFGRDPGAVDHGTLRELIRVVVPGSDGAHIRATWGAQSGWFDADSRSRLTSARFRISTTSDRVGVRLEGPKIVGADAGAMATEGTACGAVQVWPSGGLVVLGADGSPTGGYPVIACVAAADLDTFAQRPLGSEVEFKIIELDEARRAMRERETLIGRAAASVFAIDLNADVGEDPAAIADGRERALIGCLSSVNIACGGHAGDERTMREVVRVAHACGCSVGAHPSYPDREGFGRRAVSMTVEELESSVAGQIATLGRIARAEGVELAHVKAHGALYHAADRDRAVAAAIGRAAIAWNADLVMVGAAGSAALEVWRSMELRAVGEGFADRRYGADGRVVARSEPGSVIEDPGEAAAQAVLIAERGEVGVADGTVVRAPCGTVCVHGDTANAAAIARAVRAALDARGIPVRAACAI